MAVLNRSLIALTFFALTCPAGAKSDVVINVKYCAKAASHVVVTEGVAIDGEVKVLESWKGDLKAGAILSVLDRREGRLRVHKQERNEARVRGVLLQPNQV
jgi:hypothetical protein